MQNLQDFDGLNQKKLQYKKLFNLAFGKLQANCMFRLTQNFVPRNSKADL